MKRIPRKLKKKIKTMFGMTMTEKKYSLSFLKPCVAVYKKNIQEDYWRKYFNFNRPIYKQKKLTK